jgi:hypothetical protein
VLERYLWNRLNTQQVGAYTEYFVKMELTMYGFQVYSTEVDDRGIDFVARHESGLFVEIQVKSVRGNSGYVFMHKSKFYLNENLYLALRFLLEGKPPELYLVSSRVWQTPSPLSVSHDYEGLKSKPEWGLNLSYRNMALLESFRFESAVSRLINTN